MNRFLHPIALILALFGLWGTFEGAAEEMSPALKAEARQAFALAEAEWRTNQAGFASAWKFAAASFDWAEFAATDSDRETLALQGIAAAQKAIELQPQSPEGHFYLGLNNGQLARTKTIGALKLVKEMERHFKKSIDLDPNFNHAAAHRSLGMLYLDAPGWPTSIGSKTKARQHLRKALELAPAHPDNHLTWLEALHSWKETYEFKRALQTYEKNLPKMKHSYSGEQWKATWQDWDRRLETIKAAAGL